MKTLQIGEIVILTAVVAIVLLMVMWVVVIITIETVEGVHGGLACGSIELKVAYYDLSLLFLSTCFRFKCKLICRVQRITGLFCG